MSNQCYTPIKLPHLDHKVPCSRCMGCRLERARIWAVRCEHEMRYHEKNTYITLTLNDDNLSYGHTNPTLDPIQLQRFWKRLRKEIKKHNGTPIKYYSCGEYGDKRHRPHYHAIIFGYDFEDKTPFDSENPDQLYTSASLDHIWGHGHCYIGTANFNSAGYVARYINKKQLGKLSKLHYKTIGEHPEFARMSQGIGLKYLEEFQTDIFPHNYVIRDGQKTRPPRYYSIKFQEKSLKNKKIMEEVKEKNKIHIYKKRKDNTPQRLKVKETIKIIQSTQLIRPFQ